MPLAIEFADHDKIKTLSGQGNGTKEQLWGQNKHPYINSR